jgi:carbon-monoxide dehydrogenase small subunit
VNFERATGKGMRKEIKVTVNGKSYALSPETHTLLVDMLRWEVGLTGTKEGCGEGMCGACTVFLDGIPVRSCLVLAMQVDGRSITTIEGLAQNSALHPLQQAFLKHGAVQCGFCTPGMIISAKALLDSNPNPTEPQIREAIGGNFCRCTGYVKIVEAIKAAAAMMRA